MLRKTLIATLLAALALTGCSGDKETAGENADSNGHSESASPAPGRPVRGEIEVAIQPLALAALPAAPAAGEGRAMLGDKSYSFAVTFCDEASPIGTGEGEGVAVAWDIREDGDHRASIKLTEGDARWVRAGAAEADWDPETRTLRYGGTFVPFRAEDGSKAQPGGFVLVCPPPKAA
jgi:hypothetical protein